MNLTVLLPTHGRPTLLRRTLDSLAACRLPAGYREAVVVENGPRAGAEAVVAEAAEVHPHLCLRYMHVVRANKSHALSEALKTVEGGLVVFLDDDVRLEPGVLAAYAEAAGAHPERAFFGGPTESDFEARPPDWLLPFFPRSVRGSRPENGHLEEFLGFNWAAYTSDLAAAGGFDPDFGPGSPTGARGQEGEMQLRLIQAGVARVPVLDALVWHYVPAERSSKAWLFRRKYLHGVAAAQFSTDGDRAKALADVVRGAAVAFKKTVARDPVGQWRALLGASEAAGRLRGSFRAVRTAAAPPTRA